MNYIFYGNWSWLVGLFAMHLFPFSKVLVSAMNLLFDANRCGID